MVYQRQSSDGELEGTRMHACAAGKVLEASLFKGGVRRITQRPPLEVEKRVSTRKHKDGHEQGEVGIEGPGVCPSASERPSFALPT